jgi:hypothetical protein
MKFLKVALVAVMLWVNLLVLQPAQADPIAEKSPEYAEITQSLSSLLNAVGNPEESGYTTEELQQKITNLQFQKYIMETTEDWGVCQNDTASTIGVYTHKPKKGRVAENTLFYLGAGQSTDDDWDCDGVYLPSGSKAALTSVGLSEDLTEPIALKITDGTRLVISSSPENIISFNLPPAQVLKVDGSTWSIPDLTQADIDAAVPNAPQD